MNKPILSRITGSFLWNVAVLVLSSAGIAIVSLLLAIGNGQQNMFYDYFRYCLTFILNWIPVLILECLLLCITGRQWIAFLAAGLTVLAMSAGNYYTMVIRNSVFSYSDVHYIGAALGVSGDYNLALNTRLVISIVFLILGTVFAAVAARRVFSRSFRLIVALAVAICIFPLWKYVYSSDAIYTGSNIVQREYDKELYKTASKGFLYPFIYSIKDSIVSPAEEYDENQTEALLDNYSDSDIPDSKRVNIIAVQLEAFTDLRTIGVKGISEDTYAFYDELKSESLHGRLVVNVNGGSTIDTEQCFLTGDYDYTKIRSFYPSFVHYLKSQNYKTVGGHPFYSYYGREFSNPCLGFEEYRYAKIYDGYPDIENLSPGKNYSDVFFFDSILRQYDELVAEGEDVFSFNVTMQGHGPYSTEEYLFGNSWFIEKDCSEIADHVVNNYLGSIADTQHYLKNFFSELGARSEPIVVVLYGDHKPWLGDDSCVAEELGIDYDTSEETGFLNYYSTEYVIWANDAAKSVCGNRFYGEGPVISVCYLFPLLFKELGWDGSGFAKYLFNRMETLNVITSNGIFYEKDCFIRNVDLLSDEGREALKNAENIRYYRRTHFYR